MWTPDRQRCYGSFNSQNQRSKWFWVCILYFMHLCAFSIAKQSSTQNYIVCFILTFGNHANKNTYLKQFFLQVQWKWSGFIRLYLDFVPSFCEVLIKDVYEIHPQLVVLQRVRAVFSTNMPPRNVFRVLKNIFIVCCI